MKRTELKQVLKPLIKECIKEVILEEGILSNVVSEVVKGMGASTIVEQKPAPVKEERLYNVNSDSMLSFDYHNNLIKIDEKIVRNN